MRLEWQKLSGYFAENLPLTGAQLDLALAIRTASPYSQALTFSVKIKEKQHASTLAFGANGPVRDSSPTWPVRAGWAAAIIEENRDRATRPFAAPRLDWLPPEITESIYPVYSKSCNCRKRQWQDEQGLGNLIHHHFQDEYRPAEKQKDSLNNRMAGCLDKKQISSL